MGMLFNDHTSTNPNVAWSAGAMISTLDDLRVWAKALATGALLKPETHVEQLRFGTIANSGGLSVGYVLGITKFGDFIGITARSSATRRPCCTCPTRTRPS